MTSAKKYLSLSWTWYLSSISISILLSFYLYRYNISNEKNISKSSSIADTFFLHQHSSSNNSTISFYATWRNVINPFHDNKQDPFTLYVFFPGNPGIPHLYMDFLSHVHHHLKKTQSSLSHHILLWSHAGHCTLDPYQYHQDEKMISLSDQIVMKQTFLHEIVKLHPSIRIVLIGHSIGAYMVTTIAVSLHEHVDTLLLLHPTLLHMRKTPQGEKLHQFFPYFASLGQFVHVIRQVCPSFLLSLLVKSFGHSKNISHGVLEILHGRHVRQILYMADNEMETVLELTNEMLNINRLEMKISYSCIAIFASSNRR